MAVISPSTFDPLKRYIGVRLQQGVPILDGDWNEWEDVRRFELRAFLKWFVGDGIPEGTDGFRVVGTGVNNDFTLSAGLPSGLPSVPPVEKGLRQVGRCLVDGLDVILPADLGFRAQPLHVSQPGSAALATAWGVPQVPELPALNGTLLVYLDVWERLVTPGEDAGLIRPGIGEESCARLRREWVVRFRQGDTVPVLKTPPDPDFLPGHGYCVLARITRRAGSGAVQAADVADLRERRVLLPPATLIEDLLGTTPTRYRQGLDRPLISLRAALKAVVQGELPATPEQLVTDTPGGDSIRRGFFVDGRRRLQAWWQVVRSGAQQVVGCSLNLEDPGAGFSPLQQYTTGPAQHTDPDAAPLPDGGALLTYQLELGGASVHFKRVQPNLDPGAAEQLLAAGGDSPSVVVGGDVAAFFFFASSASQWQFRRFRHTDNTFLDTAPKPLVTIAATTQRHFHAAADKTGRVWAACRTSQDIAMARLSLTDGVVTQLSTLNSGGIDRSPFVLPLSSGEVYVFWSSDSQGVMFGRFGSNGALVETAQVPRTSAGNDSPVAVEDAEGALWLFFTLNGNNDLWFVRRGPDGTWGVPRQFMSVETSTRLPHALMLPDGAIALFYLAFRGGASNVGFRRIFPRV